MASWVRSWRRRKLSRELAASSTDVEASASAAAPVSRDRPAPFFVGRQDALDELAALQYRFAVVAGDAGIGKSEVLKVTSRALQEAGRVLVSPPVALSRRPGALQEALFASLGSAIAADPSQAPAMQWATVVRGAIDRANQAQVRDMLGAAHAFVIDVVRARFGDAAADLLVETGQQMRLSAEAQLSARIAAAADPDALTAFVILADEAVRVTRRPIVVVIDGAERLSDGDFRMLMDLIEQLPENIHLISSHTTSNAPQLARVRELSQVQTVRRDEGARAPIAVARAITLDPLTRDQVMEWIAEAGVAIEVRHRVLGLVLQTTGAYPLHVDQAIKALLEGRHLETLGREDAFVARTQQTYAVLTAEEQRAVMLLSPFADPPDIETILAITGATDLEWSLLERRLAEARVFVVSVRGRPWFHELGRRAIWAATLSESQRQRAAGIAVEAIVSNVARNGALSVQNGMDLVTVAPLAGDQLLLHAGLADSLTLSDGALAVLGALIELTDGDNQGALDASYAVGYARTRFPLAESVSNDSVEELEERGFAVSESNKDATIIVPWWPSPAAHAAVIGRISARLERVPVRSIASAVIKGHLLSTAGPFESAHYGVGRPTITNLSTVLKEFEFDREMDDEGRVLAGLHRERPGLLLRPRIDDIGLYLAVNFATPEQRDLARGALAGMAADTFAFGERLSVGRVDDWPARAPLPSKRFSNAAELVLGTSFHTGVSGAAQSLLAPVANYTEELQLSLSAWSVVRELASPLERDALDVDEAWGYAFAAADGWVIVGEVRGREPSVVEVDWTGAIADLPHRRELLRAIDLATGERLTAINARTSAPKNPVLDILMLTKRRFTAFNRAQTWRCQYVAPANFEDLATQLNESHQRAYDDATAFIASGLLPTIPGRALGQDVYLRFERERDRPIGVEWTMYELRLAAESGGAGVVRVSLESDSAKSSQDAAISWMDADAFRRWFDLPTGAVPISVGVSEPESGISNLLGYERILMPDLVQD